MHSRSRSSNKAAPALIWLLAWMATVLFGWAPNALSCLWSFSMLALDRVDGGVIIEHTHTGPFAGNFRLTLGTFTGLYTAHILFDSYAL